MTQYNSSLSSFVPNFKILTQVVAGKSLTEKKVYIQTDRQTCLTNTFTEKAKTIYPKYFVPFIYTIHFAYLKVYTKFENTGSKRNREICDINFHWRERKCTNKGTDKQYVAAFLLHNTTNHYQALCQISES